VCELDKQYVARRICERRRKF